MTASPSIEQAGELRDARVESLRGLSVLGVLVVHAVYWSANAGLQVGFGPWDRAVTLAARPGAFLLFVGTGCLLYGPFARRDFGHGGCVDLRRYALNRVVRILPVYCVALVAVLAVQERGATVRDWLVYASFSQNFVVFPNDQVNRVLWYLVVEVHFYVALPLLALLIAALSRGAPARAAAVLGVLALASFAFFLFVWHIDPTPDPVWRFSLPSMFFFLAGGMALALLRVSWEQHRPGWLRGPAATTDTWICAAGALWLLSMLCPGKVESVSSTVLVLALTVLLVGACVLPLRPGPLVRALGWRPLALVGVSSYSLYLWHDPLLKALARSSWGLSGWIELLAVGLPICLLVAFISYAVIEVPALRLRRRWSPSSPAHCTDRPT